MTIKEKLKLVFDMFTPEVEVKEEIEVKKFDIVKLKEGEVYVDVDEMVGAEIYMDEAMTELAPDGEYTLEDGRVIVTVEGKVTEIKEVTEEEKVEEEMEVTDEDIAVVEVIVDEKMLALEERIKKLEDAILRLTEVSVEMSQEFSSIKTKPAGDTVNKKKEVKAEEFESKPTLARVMRNLNKK